MYAIYSDSNNSPRGSLGKRLYDATRSGSTSYTLVDIIICDLFSLTSILSTLLMRQ